MKYLSANFTLDEATFSQTASRLGIDNDPPIDLVANIKAAAYGLEEVRKELGSHPILVSSWYRSAALNSAVRGAAGSSHLLGFAIDFTCPSFGTVDDIVRRLTESAIPYRQLIREFGRWVHIDFSGDQRQALIIDQTGTRSYA
jgi:zinc D-Ala-D-Ala carboxypeptidase